MGLDLPESQPVAQSSDVVTFGTPSGKAAPPKRTRLAQKMEANDDSLDLDDAPLEGPAVKNRPTTADLEESRSSAHVAAGKSRAKGKARGKREMIAAAALGAVVLGAGAFFGLQYMQDKNEKGEAIGQQGDGAQKLLISEDPGHWMLAIDAAMQMQTSDPNNIEAAAIVAEGHYASALDNGAGALEHQKQGATAILAMRKLKGTSAHVALAEGLHAIFTLQFETAIKQLQTAVTQNKKNPNAPLYLGWAYASMRDYGKAVEAFDASLAIAPKRISPLYGKASAQLAAGKKKEASETFLQISSIKKDHFGAQLGIARLATIENLGGRESRYLEILGRADIETQDPRTVSEAFSLAGDEARRAARLAVASERYTNALKRDPNNLEAIVGQASVSALKNNTDDAQEKLERVLALAPSHIQASMLLIEVSMSQGNGDKAANLLASLIGREPKIEDKKTLAKMELLKGRLLSSDESATAETEAAYRKAIDLSGDADVAASLELAAFLAKLDRAEEGIAVLAPLQEKAKDDATLAVSLGVAYLAGKDTETAIKFFRDALRQRPTDAEARFQLGRALASDGKTDEAIQELDKAYNNSENREDIGLELAEIYRRLGRNEEAIALFSKVLANAKPSRNARAKAGEYFARMHEYDKAAAIGEALLKENPEDPAGLYLTGEKLFQDGEFSQALKRFESATKADPLPQYFDALGRANENLKSFTKGMRAYEQSIAADPDYLEPRLGLASIRMARREFALALKVLEDALVVDPKNAATHFAMGNCHLELRDNAAAIDAFKQAVALQPDDGLGYLGLGKAYDASSRQKEAAVAYAKATTLAGETDAPWLAEAYRLQGYAIRESGGSERGTYEAWTNYIDRVKIESDQSKEVDKLLIPMRAKYR